MTAREDQEKEKASRESLSKFFYDLARACFTAMVIGDVVMVFQNEKLTAAAVWLFVIGLLSTSIFATIGYKILKG